MEHNWYDWRFFKDKKPRIKRIKLAKLFKYNGLELKNYLLSWGKRHPSLKVFFKNWERFAFMKFSFTNVAEVMLMRFFMYKRTFEYFCLLFRQMVLN